MSTVDPAAADAVLHEFRRRQITSHPCNNRSAASDRAQSLRQSPLGGPIHSALISPHRVAGASRVVVDVLVDRDVDRTLVERSKAGLTKKGEHLTDAWIAARIKWLLDRCALEYGCG
jgi:hypothetical protein